MQYSCFATCPKGLETLLLEEVSALGADGVRETVAGVYFSGEAALLYRVCLWSRLANKILLPLATLSVENDAELYQGVYSIPWEEHMQVDATLRVDFLGSNQLIRNTQFGAMRVKDAIVDRFQHRDGARPSVAKTQPQITINARLSKGQLHLSLDLSGQSLHRRGYRRQQGEAPIKENLAVALLLRANWPAIAADGGHLIDPFCGSATLLIEGMMMAADVAPGLLRQQRADSYWGLSHWRQFQPAIWATLIEEAKTRREQGMMRLRQQAISATGYDRDGKVLQAATANIQQAGFQDIIRVSSQPVAALTRPESMVSGLVISNPPYGERLGDETTLAAVYRDFGKALKTQFCGWQAAVITANVDLAKAMGLRARKKYKFYNGTLASQLVCFAVEESFFKDSPRVNHRLSTVDDLSPGALMVYNRLKKNQKQLRKWLAKEQLNAYRLYDADLPEYAAVIDVYDQAVHIQEYAPPTSVDNNKARQRLQAIIDATRVFLALPQTQVFVKQRRQQKGKAQYEVLDQDDREHLTVREYQASFYINLWRYMDSGLFLDHRPVRKRINAAIGGKSFLNLFCYTATATVQAALGGAANSVSVDMSNTYLDWAQKNFALNNINLYQHQLVQQDCLQWLKNCRQGFDSILLDPPSFSNSKRMDHVLDIQRDHVALIRRCIELLNPKGTLLFSTNLRSFRLDQSLVADFHCHNISAETLDPDFQRNPKIHQCWEIFVE
ncbi:MAG: bifunctional 23S rRNA (guanine(2069)-N(7))-methyltransferase RlmK/23S rRNA (guanine(2445)-N(2))-methyltransferase RlmL [Cellvibrionaceae bacterium]|nr:bifunctional 23S rRNA (guanine(2069)-N(7))-methyltransferase RlmK/23S rRNA (guanine(2445)-N(2))-methyltransferase RlmL [Cellvibrionaceae bacterium]